MTPADRWNRACLLLEAMGGSAVVQTNGRGGCSGTVRFGTKLRGLIGKMTVKSKPGQTGDEAIEAVTVRCVEVVEDQARVVRARLAELLDGGTSGGAS